MFGQFLSLAVIALPIFVFLDLLWLGFIAKTFYRSRLDHLTGDTVWLAAIVFYLIFIGGLTFFATLPAVERASLLAAIMLGAIYGLCTYATYDLTNHATLRDWPLIITVVDIAWGTVLGATVAGLTYFIYTTGIN